jgi:hypothetical protein
VRVCAEMTGVVALCRLMRITAPCLCAGFTIAALPYLLVPGCRCAWEACRGCGCLDCLGWARC